MWTLEIDIEYEGALIEHYHTAEEVCAAMDNWKSSHYHLRVRKYTPFYDGEEFREMLKNGEVK